VSLRELQSVRCRLVALNEIHYGIWSKCKWCVVAYLNALFPNFASNLMKRLKSWAEIRSLHPYPDQVQSEELWNCWYIQRLGTVWKPWYHLYVINWEKGADKRARNFTATTVLSCRLSTSSRSHENRRDLPGIDHWLKRKQKSRSLPSNRGCSLYYCSQLGQGTEKWGKEQKNNLH
jgi:hypothetical protein